MKIITTANAADYLAWYAKALRDDSVWPHMSYEKRWCAHKVEDDDWHRLIVMDDHGMGCGRLSPDRGSPDVSISLWVLKCEMRPVIAACLLKDMIGLCPRYGVEWVEASCHESNDDSRRLLTKILGSPWGFKPAAAWNGLKGYYEDSIHFRAKVSDVAEAFASRLAVAA